MFKAQEESKEIVKIVHVTSVIQPWFYEATRTRLVAVWHGRVEIVE